VTRPTITDKMLDAVVDALIAEAERQRELTKDVKQRGPAG
jgi:hypothetical protein